MRSLVCLIRSAGILLMLAIFPAAHAAELNADAQAFVQEMVERHGFQRAALERMLRETKFLSSIVRAMDAPATALPWREFRPRHINDARFEGGLRFWAEHAALLERAATEYRVAPEIIVATIGIETLYGRNTGRVSVLDALATLAFGYPRRAAFFRGELEQFLLLARENGWPPGSVRGSFAGAIGVPQFLPSSYRKYAVDFDGDGRSDLRGIADAIGSVANYYRGFGWRMGEPVVIPADVGSTVLDPLLAAGIAPHLAVGEFRKRGVLPLEPVPDETPAALIAVETDTGPRHFLALNNFYVITRYNRSINYAMAVQELAATLRQLRGRGAP
ncbi:MAG: lytic murein transglycosylase B [Burkholderiales bacterium]|nr:lytic murein transglycosylase B [Burkholderiales bacterium]MCW5603403.1 lytic murein transglycosylase B [Burkholderiales bacterium]